MKNKLTKKNYVEKYFFQNMRISSLINKKKIEDMASEINQIRKNKGRIFFLGVGGSAGNSSHAVNDFRKLCSVECYAPTDNISEFSARVNDEGFDSTFIEWLKISNLKKKDAIFIFSVGGGNKKKRISTNLIKAIDYAKTKKSKILGIVGRKDGYTYNKGDLVIDIPVEDPKLITPHSESFQAIIWHCLVSHPLLQVKKTTW